MVTTHKLGVPGLMNGHLRMTYASPLIFKTFYCRWMENLVDRKSVTGGIYASQPPLTLLHTELESIFSRGLKTPPHYPSEFPEFLACALCAIPRCADGDGVTSPRLLAICVSRCFLTRRSDPNAAGPLAVPRDFVKSAASAVFHRPPPRVQLR